MRREKFVPEDQRTLFLFDEDLMAKHKPINEIMDRVDKRRGVDKINLCSMDIQRTWKVNQKNLTPCYTTKLEHLPIIKA